jgi:hypothetical protein
MADERELDHILRRRFAALRESDARESPAFHVLFAQARDAGESPALPAPGVPPATGPARAGWRRVVLYAAGPMLTAAGLGAVWFNASRRAEREFTETVNAWSQTSANVLRAPTDRLLVLPGDEYLRTVPAVGRNAREARRGS